MPKSWQTVVLLARYYTPARKQIAHELLRAKKDVPLPEGNGQVGFCIVRPLALRRKVNVLTVDD
jgi:hypothetical protein